MIDTRPSTIRDPQLEPDAPPAPIPPVQPGLDDCCRSGCTPCVFDLYEEAMERYRIELAKWTARYGRR
jgi:Oxidoreductase-like protein, N-terminal